MRLTLPTSLLSLLASTYITAVVNAQAGTNPATGTGTCIPDVLVDDFRPRNASMRRTQPPGEGCEKFTDFNGCEKTLNLLGGDYGDAGCNQVMTDGRLTITTRNVSAVINNLESESHPGTAVSFNYWFVKFAWEYDFDLSIYSGLAIDLIAPPNSDFNITLTQWLPATNTRGLDSVYNLMSKYLTPDGTPQTLRMPWSDFKTNLEGGEFKLEDLKDLTVVNMGPVGSTFVFTKIVLLGNCTKEGVEAGTGSTTAGAQGTGTGVQPAASAKPTSGALGGKGGKGAVASLGVAFVTMLTLKLKY
ncbi:hypothetical protein HDV05_008469 [Chytridiales sp. JEL 0842]|nr:hypothetical protein HDV05_008469 [Chytridiales sp. JEL 0842]